MEEGKDATADGSVTNSRKDFKSNSDPVIPQLDNDEKKYYKDDKKNVSYGLPNVSEDVGDEFADVSDFENSKSEKRRRASKKPRAILLDFHSSALQAIYANDATELKVALDDKKQGSMKLYKYEILVCFVLSIHIKSDMITVLQEYDPWVESLLSNLVEEFIALEQGAQFLIPDK